MRYLLAPLAACALLWTAASVSAEEMKGTVVEVDEAQGVIMLDSGESFTLAEGVTVEGLQPGTEVTVSYEDQDGEKVASQIESTQ